jgi:hypothetical protein
MSPNYQMIMERHPNQTEWLLARFLAVKLSLYCMENYPGGQVPHVFQKRKEKKNNKKLHVDYDLLAQSCMIKQQMEEHGEIDVRMVYTLWYSVSHA